MFRPRNFFVAALLMAVTTISACGGTTSSTSSASSAAGTSVPALTSSAEATTPAAVDSPMNIAPSEPSYLSTAGQAQATYQAGRKPASGTYNGKFDAGSYVQAVRRNNNGVWGPALQAANLELPTLQYDATMPGETFNSHCLQGGARITLTSKSTYMLYCQQDMKPYGSIAIPASVLNGLWNNGKPSKKVADLAVAMAVTRQAGFIVTASLEDQLGLQNQLSSEGRQYMATCLAGVWAHGVYTLSDFQDSEMINALTRAVSAPSSANGVLTTASAANDDFGRAWNLGFNGDEDNPGGGNVAVCIRHLWR